MSFPMVSTYGIFGLYPLLKITTNITSDVYHFLAPTKTHTILDVIEWIELHQLKHLLQVCMILCGESCAKKDTEIEKEMNMIREKTLTLHALVEHTQKLYGFYQSTWFFSHSRIGDISSLMHDLQKETMQLHIHLSLLQHLRIHLLC